jgi:hypothetical protein
VINEKNYENITFYEKQEKKETNMRNFFCLLLACFTATAVAGELLAAETTFYGYTWLRYSVLNSVRDAAGTTASSNSFEIPRCYIRMKTKINDFVSGQVTLDINNSSKAQSYITTTTGGMVAAQTTVADWRTYLKYAYAEFGGLIPDAVIRMGMQKVYFATLDIWEYPTIQKEITDLAGLLSSADQGIAIDGNIPGGWGDYQIGLFNGTGYAKIEDNARKAACVSAMIVPCPGIWLRGSYYADITTSGASDTLADKIRGGIVMGFNFYPVNGHIEYVAPVAPKTGVSGAAAEIFLQSKIPADISILKNMDVVIRADYYKADAAKSGTNAGTSDACWVIGGVNYKAAENVILQFNVENKVYEKTGFSDTTYTAQTVLNW